MTIEQAQKEAKKNLSFKRYNHTKNVAKAAQLLALRWGQNSEKAQIAAWLHDIVKEKRTEELLQLMQQDAIMAGLTIKKPRPIWHATCGAIYAKHFLHVQDETILSAISCHTTGRVGMTDFEKILFLADMICDERKFDGVDNIRELAQINLNKAIILAMRENIKHLKAAGKILDCDTIDALQALEAQSETGVEVKV